MLMTKLFPLVLAAVVALLFLLDFSMGGPVMAPGVLGVSWVIWWAGRKQPRTPVWQRNSLILLALASAATVGAITLEVVQARSNRDLALPLVPALKAYCADNGALPKTLERLVPRYIDAIPRQQHGLSELDVGYAPLGNYQHDGEDPCFFMLRLHGVVFPRYHSLDSHSPHWEAIYD